MENRFGGSVFWEPEVPEMDFCKMTLCTNWLVIVLTASLLDV